MPLVSIILPTFNRARFLPEAFASIEAQTWTDWELIVVDDGSIDETPAIVQEYASRAGPKVRSVRQPNKGAYGARNTGLDLARGDYVAFFDSDDLWLPHHLERCLTGFDAARDVDWVYAACRSIDASGAVVQATVFEPNGRPLPFLSLATRAVGALHVIEDDTVVECQLSSGMFAGLQNSVIRRAVFHGQRFWEEYRVVEDALFLLRALLRGLRLAYLTDVHVVYRIHEGNSSASAAGLSTDALYRIRQESVEGLERIQRETTLTAAQRAALKRRLAQHYFWDIGYVCFLASGDTPRALRAFRRGLRLAPSDLRMWKTYLGTAARSLMGRRTV